jgi:hypothetical protein
VAWPRKKEPPITRDEVTQLMLFVMTMDWKLSRMLEEMGIDDGEAPDRP